MAAASLFVDWRGIGTKPGRTTSDEITLFKSLGLAAAEYIYRQAQAERAGMWIEF